MSPRTWTYCSKKCEVSRLGPGEAELPDDVLESLLDKQIAMETSSKGDRRLLKADMRREVKKAYDEAVLSKRSSHPPLAAQFSRSENEFWEMVLREHQERYLSARKQFGFYFIKFCRAALECYTYDGIEVVDLMSSTEGISPLPITMQEVADICESGAMQKFSRLLPRDAVVIAAMLALTDDQIGKALESGDLGPDSSVSDVESYASREAS